MIISRRQRFVLLAPWKTASSTSHLRLAQYNESPYSRFYDFNPYLQRVVTQHVTYPEFAMLPESREGYFIGAFVRNPYDKVYSGFLQLQKDVRHFQQHPSQTFPTPWIKPLVLRQISDNLAQLTAAEFDFDKWFALVEEYQIYEVGRNSSFPLHPAHYWTGIDGNQKVDFIGKVESFEHDFDAFCLRVDVAAGERATANVSDQPAHSQGMANARYLSRMSAASISKINTLFTADFELFGYETHSC
jgi:sulfotransferase famil protein